MSDKPSHVTGTLLTIGDEILLGDISNENAQYIAIELRARGFRLDRVITVGDIEDDIVEYLGQCLKRISFYHCNRGPRPNRRRQDMLRRFQGPRKTPCLQSRLRSLA